MKNGTLDYIDAQHNRMVELVTHWCNINSGTRNLSGLALMLRELTCAFEALGGEITEVALPGETVIDNAGQPVVVSLGRALSIRKRPSAQKQVLLSIHMDTVYGVAHAFQRVKIVDAQTMIGPGVADAKGGIAVMLIALEALEKSGKIPNLGWEVLLNPDEEVGSPGSGELLEIAARRNHLGLVFEPAHADGALVGERKGSNTFTFVVRGRSAHAGRDFHKGRNAVHAAAKLVAALDELNLNHPGVTVNVGSIDGGGPANIVPDLAIVRCNIRMPAHAQQQRIEGELTRIVESIVQMDGISAAMHGRFTSPARAMTVALTSLYQKLADCGKEIGQPITWHASGGASDANKLSAAGLPVIDTLGPCGGSLHSDEEFLLTASLTAKAKLTATFLEWFARQDAGG